MNDKDAAAQTGPFSRRLGVDRLNPELKLLTYLARPVMDEPSIAEAGRLLDGAIAWDSFLQLAEYHGLVPLACQNLNAFFPERVPEPVRSFLQHGYEEAALRQLQFSGELVLILKEFEAAGIPVLPYKGPVLAATLYGGQPLRDYCDLDLLVQKKDVAAASRILRKRGYTTELAVAEAAMAPVVRHSYEVSFYRKDGLVVDLHWRLHPAGIPAPFSNGHLWANLTAATFQGVKILEMSPEQLLLYLCMHGGKHRWWRLSWIVDLACFLEIYEQALNSGAVVAGVQEKEWTVALLTGLHLAHTLFAAPLPAQLRAAAVDNPRVRELADSVIDSYAGPAEGGTEREVEQRLQHLPWLTGWRQRSRYLARLVFAPSLAEWRLVRLPRILYPLYYLLRPLRLLTKYGLPVFRRKAV